MTVDDLRLMLNYLYGMDSPWPEKFEVDAETYGYCCQELFNQKMKNDDQEGEPYDVSVRIQLGPHKGILFKGVELILTEKR